MHQKIILTTEQHEKLMNHLLSEMVADSKNLINEDGTVNEGVWTNIKYGLSKLGRYKAGGKILGKDKVDKESAEKIKQIIEKKGNEVIKNLDANIKEKNPEFPNNKEGADFLNTIMEISAVYDSIIAATKLEPNDEKYLPIDAANGVINDLREYVKKFLDVDLKSVYSVVDEAEGNALNVTEEELQKLDEEWGLNETEEVINEEEADLKAGDVRDKLNVNRKTRGVGKDFDSERIKTLKSNKLPLILAGIGGALGGLSWLAQTEWFKEWLEGLLGGDTTLTSPDIVKDVTGGAPDSKGMLHWMGEIDGRQMKTGADVQAFIEKYGADNVKHMFDGNGGGPSETQIQQLQQLVGGENASKPVGELFNPQNDTFGSMKGGQNLFGVSKAASFLAQIVIKKGITSVVKGAGTALAAKFAGLGSVLGPIGIGLFAAGVLVKLMRKKGQKSSRAATLNYLYQSIRNIEGGVGVVKPEGETIGKDEAQDPAAIEDKNKKSGEQGAGAGDEKTGGGTKGVGDDDLYNSLQNLFRFIVASNKKFGAGPDGQGVPQGNPEGGNAPAQGGQKQGSDAEGGFKAGETNNRDIEDIDFEDIPNQPASADASSGQRALPANKQQKGLPDRKSLSSLEETEMLDEAKYFRDKDVVKYLNKNLSPNRVKEFENFMNRVEQIRNKIRNMKDTDDKVFNQKIATIKNNPIILTDFNKLFNISSANPQAYQNLAKFINDIFTTVYSGKFKKGQLIDKLGTMGKVPAKDLDEAGKQAGRSQFEKDAQDRKKFKGHLMSFLTDAIGLFQYLFQQRKNKAAQGGNQQNTDKQAQKLGLKPKPERKKAAAPSGGDEAGGTPGGGASSQAATESVINNNSLIKEEINKIKKIMSGLI
jgi:hypothetical protein